jgi:hypothetical protein|tara:strand:- start:12728 stop:12883 length:156 start_codon:yes stop_codon:yes gene_type:complete
MGLSKKNIMFIGFSNLIETGLMLGWEYYPPNEDDQSIINLYLVFICLHFKW